MEFRPPQREVIPPVVKNLLIINVLVFIATAVIGKQGIDISDYLALHHWSSDKFRIWQLLTHMFMHGDVGHSNALYDEGFMHLFSNMFGLWMFGSILEQYWNSKRFLIFYLLCGFGAALLHLGVLSFQYHQLHQAISAFNAHPDVNAFSQLFHKYHLENITPFSEFKSEWLKYPTDDRFAGTAKSLLDQYYTLQINEPTVGASGAVFGILFGFGFLFPNTIMMLLFLPIPIKAKYFVAMYALFELYSGISNSAGDNIAHFAHLGGMIVAFIIIKYWNMTNRKTLY